MKILLVSRYIPFPGGRENFVFELSQKLKEKNLVSILTPDGLIGEGVDIYLYEKDTEYLVKIIEKINPDIVNSHTFYMCDLLLDICNKKNIPFVITLHGDQFLIGDLQRQKLVTSVVKKADHIITVCKAGKDSLIKNTSVDETRISVINNGINIDVFNSNLSFQFDIKNQMKIISKIPLDRFIFLAPARMVWYKGVDILVEMINEKKKWLLVNKVFFLLSVPNSSISKEEIDYLNKILIYIRENELQNLVKVMFAGYEFMPYMYRLSDGFILNSLSEQFPISILEAMSSDIPVIATDVGGVNEIIKDGFGILIKPKEKEELFNAIVETVVNKKEVKLRIKKAKENINNLLSITCSAEKYEKLYLKLIDKSL